MTQKTEKLETNSKVQAQKIEAQEEALKHVYSDSSDEIFRGMFFSDEQYQDRGGANWQLWG